VFFKKIYYEFIFSCLLETVYGLSSRHGVNSNGIAEFNSNSNSNSGIGIGIEHMKKTGIGIGIGIEPNSVNSASIPFELFFNPLSFFILNIRFSSHFLHFKNESTGLLKPVLSYIFHSKKCTCYKDESQYCTAWPSFIHTLGSVYIYVSVKPFVIFMKM